MQSSRPSCDTLRSLRITLQKLEQNSDGDEDASAMVELKRILLNRIAELEVVSALESEHPEELDTPDPAALPALLQMGEANSAKETGDTSDPDRFD